VTSNGISGGHTGKFVAYYRVSTQRQGRSGLGLEAQQTAVRDFLDGGDWRLVAEVTEVESGKRNDRRSLPKPSSSAAFTARSWSSRSLIGSPGTWRSYRT
jgi:hypothetical protein